MKNSDISPLIFTETINSSEYEKTKLSGVRTDSGFVFYDNSTLEAMRTCPRYFYFKHIRKFDPLGIRVPLIFGSSWHSAMDYYWPNAAKGKESKEQLLEGSFNNFLKIWNASEVTSLLEMDIYPRTPTKALEVLKAYDKLYGEDLKRYKVLNVERPFIIPLTNDEQKLMYIGKIDKEIEDERAEEVIGIDHKTTGLIGQMWENSFSPNSQFDGYHHAERMHYGSAFKQIWIDGVQIHKTKIDFRRLPLMRQVSQVERWLWETLEWIAEIQYNEDLLLEYRKSNKKLNFLPAFKCNTKSCSNQYGKPCIYRDLCVYQNNPEDYEISSDFQESLWQPFEITEVSKKGEMTFRVENFEGE